MIVINNLHVSVNDKPIIKGLNLKINNGESHVIMGPNGTGKSTLANVIAGHPNYIVTKGSITFNGEDLGALSVEERAHHGIFLSFQNPIEIPGVTTMTFLKTIVNAQRAHRGQSDMPLPELLQLIKSKAKLLQIDEQLLKRPLNSGFSGGEKKRLETLQLLILNPRFTVLDETDSGLDIDSLRTVAEAINNVRTCDNSWLVITHYSRLLNYLKPDFVHIFDDGKIVRSGGFDLALQLEAHGYDQLR